MAEAVSTPIHRPPGRGGLALRVLFAVLLCWPASAADLLIQGAVDTELEPLLAALRDRKEIRIAAWTFWTGKLGGKSVVISRTEVGPINSAAATALGIQRFRPKAIINQGTAGAHNPELRLWDIVVGEATTDYSAFRGDHGDAGAGTDPARWKPLQHRLRLDNGALQAFPGFSGDPALVAAALKVKYDRGRVLKGNIGSAFQYNRELDRLLWLHKTYGTDSEDMESAYAAGVAVAMKVPFVAIRIISDTEWSHPQFETIAGEYCAKFVLDYVASLSFPARRPAESPLQ